MNYITTYLPGFGNRRGDDDDEEEAKSSSDGSQQDDGSEDRAGEGNHGRVTFEETAGDDGSASTASNYRSHFATQPGFLTQAQPDDGSTVGSTAGGSAAGSSAFDGGTAAGGGGGRSEDAMASATPGRRGKRKRARAQAPSVFATGLRIDSPMASTVDTARTGMSGGRPLSQEADEEEEEDGGGERAEEGSKAAASAAAVRGGEMPGDPPAERADDRKAPPEAEGTDTGHGDDGPDAAAPSGDREDDRKMPPERETDFGDANEGDGLDMSVAPEAEDLDAEDEESRMRLLHRLATRRRAILRASCHLGESGHSFVYDDFDANLAASPSAGPPRTAMNGDVEPGLPYVGPGLEGPYRELREVLYRGLLGYDDDAGGVGGGGGGRPKEGEGDGTGTGGGPDDNPFLSTVKSNVSAILMGRRGVGKTLVLERALASLSRSAAVRKERILDRMSAELARAGGRGPWASSGGDGAAAAAVDGRLAELESKFAQASFRVVRLDGVLHPGSNASLCCREIARQVGEMSREEGRRNRRLLRAVERRRRRRFAELETPRAGGRRRGGSSGRRSGSGRRQRTSSGLSPGRTPAQETPGEGADGADTGDRKTGDDREPEGDDDGLRTRRTGFNTYITMLDEVLRSAKVDRIPILIVLDGIDSFLADGKAGSSADYRFEGPSGGGSGGAGHAGRSRQLLLYHLLDRVADHKFLVSVVGTTDSVHTMNGLEKRVQSRAEGTSRTVYFDMPGGHGELAAGLLGKFYVPPNDEGDGADGDGGGDGGGEDADGCYTEYTAMVELRDEVAAILDAADDDDIHDDDGGELSTSPEASLRRDRRLVRDAVRRNHAGGADMRFFAGALDAALGYLSHEIDAAESSLLDLEDGRASSVPEVPRLTPGHVARGLYGMCARFEGPGDETSVMLAGPACPGGTDSDRLGRLVAAGAGGCGGGEGAGPDDDPVARALLARTDPVRDALASLTGPQAAVLLAARRIAARDASRAGASDGADAATRAARAELGRRRGPDGASAAATPAAGRDGGSIPITYERIEDEFLTSFVRSKRYTVGSDGHPPHVLRSAFADLAERDLIRLRRDGTASGSYRRAVAAESSSASSAGDPIRTMPLVFLVDLEAQLAESVRDGTVRVSTSLREWGLRVQ